jgi:hypothetical protein
MRKKRQNREPVQSNVISNKPDTPEAVPSVRAASPRPLGPTSDLPLTPDSIISLQQSHGNQYVRRMLAHRAHQGVDARSKDASKVDSKAGDLHGQTTAPEGTIQRVTFTTYETFYKLYFQYKQEANKIMAAIALGDMTLQRAYKRLMELVDLMMAIPTEDDSDLIGKLTAAAEEIVDDAKEVSEKMDRAKDEPRLREADMVFEETQVIDIVRDHIKAKAADYTAQNSVIILTDDDFNDRLTKQYPDAKEPEKTSGFTLSERGVCYVRDSVEIRTVVHEMVHLYSHDAFGDALGFVLNEAATDYFNEQIGGFQPTETYGFYIKNVLKPLGIDDMLLAEAYFKGNLGPIKSLLGPMFHVLSDIAKVKKDNEELARLQSMVSSIFGNDVINFYFKEYTGDNPRRTCKIVEKMIEVKLDDLEVFMFDLGQKDLMTLDLMYEALQWNDGLKKLNQVLTLIQGSKEETILLNNLMANVGSFFITTIYYIDPDVFDVENIKSNIMLYCTD